MQFIDTNIPDTVLGKDKKTLYQLVHVSGYCYNLVEIVYPVHAHPVPIQPMPSTPVHSGKKNWHNKGPRSHNGNQKRGPQQLNQASIQSAGKKENEVIVSKPKQPAQGNQNRGPRPLNQANIQSAGKKENEVIVLNPMESAQPAQQPKSGAPKKRYYKKEPKKAPVASAASQEAVVPQEQVPVKVVEEKVAVVTVDVSNDC